MASIAFDYRYHVPHDETSAFPAAEVKLQGADEHWRSFILFVDSGAHLTILSASDADRLGVELTKGKLINLYGISGKVRAYIHRVPLQIGETALHADVAFCTSDDAPMLLVRADIFSRFIVTFRESHRKTIFTEESAASVSLKI
jgi:hypothetical protein